MKGTIILLFMIALSFLGGYFFSLRINDVPYEGITLNRKKIEKPFEKYSIENLKNTNLKIGCFKEEEQDTNDKFTKSLFRFSFYPALDNSQKETTGIINRPLQPENETFPLVILFRGYVDQKIYISGMGLKNVGEYLASNGFITIAPDFLGYAGSDGESDNIFETRFQTYVTALSIINYIEEKGIRGWDGKNIAIWGHSNGGQIALTVLEISGGIYPTVLWAPVTKPFPYSVLYYTDESEDRGKLIRKELSKFELLYDVEKYSLTNYLDNINSPIQIHQGTNDYAVPVSWSNDFVNKLKSLKKDVEYIKYNAADHNLNPKWDEAVEKSLVFFRDNLK